MIHRNLQQRGAFLDCGMRLAILEGIDELTCNDFPIVRQSLADIRANHVIQVIPCLLFDRASAKFMGRIPGYP